MTEAELLAQVTRLCGQLGLLWHHCPRSDRCQGTTGFPDLVIAGPYGVIFAELKSADGETSPGQDRWAWILNRAAETRKYGRQISYLLWRPDDLFDGVTVRDWLTLIATGVHAR